MLKKITDLYKRPLVRDTIHTTVLSTIGKGAGFLIPFFIAAWFGVSGETDAFFFAYGLILFLSGIFAPVVESVIVPYIAEARTNNEDVGKFVGNILCVSGLALLALAALFILLIKPLLSVITRFDPQALLLIHRLLIETAPMVVFLTWTSILAGTLNTYKRFAFPAISPAFRAVVNIAIIFAFKDKYGVHAIAFGYVIGEFVRLVILFIILKKLKLFKLCFSLQFGTKLRLFFKTASYRIIGMIAGSFTVMVDKVMASWLNEGDISILNYADRLYMIPVTIMISGFMPVILSHWSGDYYQNEGKKAFLQKVRKIVKLAFLGSTAMFVILLLFGQTIIHLAFFRGKFSSEFLPVLKWTFTCYLCGLVPYVVSSVLVRYHLVLKNTAFLMKLAILSCLLNILLNLILMQFFGVIGIAFSTCFTVLVIAVLLFISIHPTRIEKTMA